MTRSALGPAAEVGSKPSRRALAVVADTGQWSGAGHHGEPPRAGQIARHWAQPLDKPGQIFDLPLR